MPRQVLHATRARGSLAVDPKTDEGAWAGARQHADAEVALAHNVGGSGATCVVHVFGRSPA